VDGLAAVTERVADLQARLGTLAPPTTNRASTSAVAAAAPTSFSAALDTAVSDTTSKATSATTSGGVSAAPSAAWERLVSTVAPERRTAAAPTSPGRLNADGIPADLAAYGNGKVPASALASIGHGSHRLWTPAAQAFRSMEAAAAKAGVDIGVTDSYRSYEAQVDVARRKGLYSQGGLAATPGTSDHGWGRSLDLDLDSRALAWMRAHADEYGFDENVPRESWHWTYSPPS